LCIYENVLYELTPLFLIISSAGSSFTSCRTCITLFFLKSEFTGYPGFKSSFEEYNDKWFTNQKVLRGGSFGTPKMSVRGSYRNFFRLDERWLFSGFRCVENS